MGSELSRIKPLTPEQQKAIRDGIRLAKMRMTIMNEKPKVSLPKLNFMEKKDD